MKNKKEMFNFPKIDELLENTQDWRIFSVLDLASGYYQIQIEEESKEKTAFLTTKGKFQFLRMPFRLVNAPFYFNQVMQQVFGLIQKGTVERYMDDFVVGAADVSEILRKLRFIFDLLRKAKLTCRLSKCVFGCEHVTFVGFRLLKDGLFLGLDKLEDIRC